MLIAFSRAATGSTVATIHRGDGVVLELPGYDRKYRVPHDLAHAVTERELGMLDGVFGSIAGGGVFANMKVVRGRPRYDAAARSRRLLDANARSLGAAEVLAGAVHDTVEHKHRDSDAAAKARMVWASLHTDPFPWTDQQLTDAARKLAVLAVAWQRDGSVEMTWPDRLTSPCPGADGVKRGRRGRA